MLLITYDEICSSFTSKVDVEDKPDGALSPRYSDWLWEEDEVSSRSKDLASIKFSLGIEIFGWCDQSVLHNVELSMAV